MRHASGLRAVVISLSAVAVVTSAAVARGADATAAQCIAANDSATKLRGQGKLLDARDALLSCAAPKCPASVREECEKSLDEVNQALPTVVFEPKDASGNDVLTPVKVSMDGKPLQDKLDGRGLSVDPGTHEFTFETAGQAPVKKTLLIHEAEKDRHEVVAFGGASAPASAPATTPAPAAGPTSASAPAAAPASSESTSSQPSSGPTPSGIEIGVSSGYMIPLGSVDGTAGDSLSNFVNGAIPLRFHLGWRFLSPNIFVGGYVSYGFSSVPNGTGTIGNTIGCTQSGVSCSANVVMYGIEGELHVLPDTVFDPWVGLGFGYEQGNVSGSGPGGSVSASASGWDYVTFSAGGDYQFLGNLGAGPFLAFTLGQYGNESASSSTGTSTSQSISNTALHEWFTIGVRGVYDINLPH
jgi:hypothetical protein